MAARYDHLLPVYTAEELAAERWALVRVEGEVFYTHAVSDLGRVRTLAGRILKPLWCHAVRGEASVYWRVCMSRGPKGARVRKAYLIHRLVAEAFVPGKSPERNVVHHKDHVTFNPRWWNLEWVNHSENQLYYLQHKHNAAEASYYANALPDHAGDGAAYEPEPFEPESDTIPDPPF